MAQDFWTGPGNIPTENPVGLNNSGIHPCIDTKGNQDGYCDPLLTPYEVQIPPMGVSDNFTLNIAINAAQAAHNGTIPANQLSEGMLIWGNVVQTASLNIDFADFSGSTAGDSSVKGTMHFTTNALGNVVIVYGGHISATEDYESIGRETAVGIPGSPYHNRLISFTGINGDTGNQDMQLASIAIVIPPSLILDKIIVNDDGGNATESDFHLTASGPTSIEGDGTPATGDVFSDNTFEAGTYHVFESGVGGYTGANTFVCTEDNGGVFNAGTQEITLEDGESSVCTVINNDIPPFLKLVKTVTNNNGGSAVPNDWNLTATADNNHRDAADPAAHATPAGRHGRPRRQRHLGPALDHGLRQAAGRRTGREGAVPALDEGDVRLQQGERRGLRSRGVLPAAGRTADVRDALPLAVHPAAESHRGHLRGWCARLARDSHGRSAAA